MFTDEGNLLLNRAITSGIRIEILGAYLVNASVANTVTECAALRYSDVESYISNAPVIPVANFLPVSVDATEAGGAKVSAIDVDFDGFPDGEYDYATVAVLAREYHPLLQLTPGTHYNMGDVVAVYGSGTVLYYQAQNAVNYKGDGTDAPSSSSAWEEVEVTPRSDISADGYTDPYVSTAADIYLLYVSQMDSAAKINSSIEFAFKLRIFSTIGVLSDRELSSYLFFDKLGVEAAGGSELAFLAEIAANCRTMRDMYLELSLKGV